MNVDDHYHSLTRRDLIFSILFRAIFVPYTEMPLIMIVREAHENVFIIRRA